MKILRLLPILFAAILLPQLAHATDAIITCTGPTTYTDGTAIATGTVHSYALYGALQGQTKTKLAVSPTCSFTRTNLAVGTQEWYLTDTIAGIESAPSVLVTKVISPPTPPTPSAPGNVVVTITVTVNAP